MNSQSFLFKTAIIMAVSFFIISNLCSQDGSSVKPSVLFGDHMIVQRGQQMKVWGTGEPGDRVQVAFQGQSKMAEVPASGKWLIILKKPNPGGPFKLSINKKKFQNIMVGDVWMAGGQSNMEWAMNSADGFEAERTQEKFPVIRFFRTPKVMFNHEVDTLSGGNWREVNSESLTDVSAVAYYFAKKIYQETEIPIGIVDHSWGGSDIEGWLPYDAFEDYPEWQKIAKEFKNRTIDLEEDQRKVDRWFEKMDEIDQGNKEQWEDPKTDRSNWSDAMVPGYWEHNGHPNVDGIVWYSRTFKMPESDSETCKLSLGQVDDSDKTYVNGKLVGSMDVYNAERYYDISSSDLKNENILTVRVKDVGWAGGFSSEAETMYLECGEDRVELAGPWKMKIGTESYPKMPVGVTLNELPANRYNAMMTPLFQFPMTGMIWYQGETNCSRPDTYSDHFHDMIDIYRKKWGHEFPFLFVQLANYLEETEPGKSSWAELRSAQESVLDMPKTAMATAIDIGEADDIHPRNKKDVGIRLAKGALALEYNKKIKYKNPHIASVSVSPEEIVVTFKEIEEGLVAVKADDIPAFHVLKTDGSYQKVKAMLKQNKVYVDVKGLEITGLYYAWADNPGKLDLYNSEGLPVLPFKVMINYK